MANLTPNPTAEGAPERKSLGQLLRELRLRLPLVSRALGLSWQAAPKLTVAWLGLLGAVGLLPAATVRVTRKLIDAVAAGLEPGAQLDEAAYWAAVMGALLILTQALQSGASLLRSRLAITVEDFVTNLIHQAAIRLDLSHFESPNFHDKLYRARLEASRRPMELLESCGGLLQNSITLLAMGEILARFGPWAPFLLVVVSAPGAIIVTRTYIREHHWQQRVSEQERRAWYYDWLLTAEQSAAEIRSYRLGEHFRKAYANVRAHLRTDRLRFAREQNLAELLNGFFALLALGLVLALMARSASRGAMSLGQLAMAFHALQLGLGFGRTLATNARRIFTSSLFLENLVTVIDLQPRIQSPEDPKRISGTPGVNFRNVTFHYPDSEKPALQDLTLDIPAGAIVAIVGPNGSGKSTLAKLLTRLYDPTQGGIEINGVDIREIDLADLRDCVAVLSQEPAHFNATVRENIRLGNINAPPNEETIKRAIEAAGAEAFVSDLPRGLENLLGKWFKDGAELSGGQWQRVSIARALARGAQIIVLDEPTSHMDPWTEQNWFQALREELNGRTCVLVTHRLNGAKIADLVVVMREGRVTDISPPGILRLEQSCLESDPPDG